MLPADGGATLARRKLIAGSAWVERRLCEGLLSWDRSYRDASDCRLPTAGRRPAALGRSEPGRLYASPYVGLAPEGLEALFNSDDLDGMFAAIETLTASAGG